MGTPLSTWPLLTPVSLPPQWEHLESPATKWTLKIEPERFIDVSLLASSAPSTSMAGTPLDSAISDKARSAVTRTLPSDFALSSKVESSPKLA